MNNSKIKNEDKRMAYTIINDYEVMVDLEVGDLYLKPYNNQ